MFMVSQYLWFYNPHNCSIIWAISEMSTLRHRTFKWLAQGCIAHREHRLQSTLKLNSWHPFTTFSPVIHHLLTMAWSLPSISETLCGQLIWSMTRFMILRKEYEPFHDQTTHQHPVLPNTSEWWRILGSPPSWTTELGLSLKIGSALSSMLTASSGFIFYKPGATSFDTQSVGTLKFSGHLLPILCTWDCQSSACPPTCLHVFFKI